MCTDCYAIFVALRTHMVKYYTVVPHHFTQRFFMYLSDFLIRFRGSCFKVTHVIFKKISSFVKLANKFSSSNTSCTVPPVPTVPTWMCMTHHIIVITCLKQCFTDRVAYLTLLCLVKACRILPSIIQMYLVCVFTIHSYFKYLSFIYGYT